MKKSILLLAIAAMIGCQEEAKQNPFMMDNRTPEQMRFDEAHAEYQKDSIKRFLEEREQMNIEAEMARIDMGWLEAQRKDDSANAYNYKHGKCLYTGKPHQK